MSLENPAIQLIVICFVAGGVLGGISRLISVGVATGLVLPLVYLVGYYAVYGLPLFPPVASVQKIFYLAVVGTILGLIIDWAPRASAARHLAILSWPLVAIVWIGWPVFAQSDFGLLATAIALWAFGSLVLWRLDTVAASSPERDGGSFAATSILAALAVGFAPVGLNGGSSSSLILCLGLAGGFAAAALWDLVMPRHSFSTAALLGAAGGVLATIDTVILITREADLLAFALLLLVLFSGQLSARLWLPRHRFSGWPRQILVAVLTCIPILLVVAALFRHPEPFPPT